MLVSSTTTDIPKGAPKPFKTPQRLPKSPQRPPKMVQDGPKMAQDGPQDAQDGPKMGPRWPQDGSRWAPRRAPNRFQIGLPRFSKIEAEKGSARTNLKRPPKAARPVFYYVFLF